MRLRVLNGVSIAVLVLFGSAISAPSAADELPARLPPAPARNPTATTLAQLAAMTEGVAQIASAAQIVTAPRSDAATLAETAPLAPAPKPPLPAKSLAARHPAKDKLVSIAGGLPQYRHPSDAVDNAARLTQVRTVGPRETGRAAWYGGRYVGRRTSSGERLDSTHATAAHRTLPLNTLVRVTNLNNGRSVVVRITDRGPVNENLLIDMSPKAAEELAMKAAGIVPVSIEQVVEVADGDK